MATDAKMAFPRSDAVRPTKLQGDGDEQHGALMEANASFLRAARAGALDNLLECLDQNGADINACNPNGLNALHLASKEGHINIVTELIDRGALVDGSTKKGNTALHIASLAGHDDIVKILVQNGATINVASQNGFTPLYMAAQENRVDIVKYLLENGARANLATEDGFTPLSVAVQQGHNQVVAVLMENDSRNKVRLPAIHVAAKKDDVQAALVLLQKDSAKEGDTVNSTTKSGFTPLHIAAHYGSLDVATLLLDNGADIDFSARNSITPLHVASKWGRLNVVEFLIDRGAYKECKTRDSLTPLHCAARSGHDQVVDLLLEKGALVTAKTKNGLTPLHMAAQGDHVESARVLHFHNAPIDEVTMDYLTPLHVAAHCGNVKMAKLLLDLKCEVNARALNGFTPLHVACKKNRIKVIELLLRYGALIESTTESGLTPLHVASFMGHTAIVTYLLENGAQTETATMRGETALHLAARANQIEVMRILIRARANVDARAKEQQTPLHISARLGSVEAVQLLLHHGATRDAATKDLYTPLHIAVKEGHEDVVEILLDSGAKHNTITRKGFTPLHIAAKYGNVPISKILLSKGASPNAEGKNGLTPLHVATHYNSVEVAQLLLQHKANPHAAAKNGYTPLHIAAKRDQVEIAKILLDHGAKANAESRNGYTPLHLAAQEGHTDVAELLLQRGANVNCRSKNLLTPMHLAAQEDQVPVAEILVRYKSEIDPQTKAGYTPLHTACHFGQLNMIRFLLDHRASVHATTKLGYTPLHQAAQQGHVLVINLLLKYNASPDALTNNGQTPLSIAQQLGYISVVEILKNITTVTVATPTVDEKYKVVFPEMMQEAPIDSDEEGDTTLPPDQSYFLSVDDAKDLRYRDRKGEDLFETVSGRQSTISSVGGRDPLHEELRYMRTGDESFGGTLTPTGDESDLRHRSYTPSGLEYNDRIDGASTPSGRPAVTPLGDEDMRYMFTDDALPVTPAFLKNQLRYEKQRAQSEGVPVEEGIEQSRHVGLTASSPLYPPGTQVSEDSRLCGSLYSDTSFASSFNPDNVSIERHPVILGFLVSFIVDARGGAMRGCRHSGIRVIVPPGRACAPTRITCKLIKREKLAHPPPLNDGESLATRILKMGPVGASFSGPVLLEVPHFASLRGQEREVTILRSDDSRTWKEHPIATTEEAVQKCLIGNFEELESAEDLYQRRVTRILTNDFPVYFALVTRIRQETKVIGMDGGLISSTVVPQVQAVFPDGAIQKSIRVGVQAQPVSEELVEKLLGSGVSVSPVVTIEPRHRKFHQPISITIPLPPKSSLRGGKTRPAAGTPTLRLLCSMTGGMAAAQWEDITGANPLTLINDCVQFTTNISARFWLIDCSNVKESTRMATSLYDELIAVPFMSKFVLFAKRRSLTEARLRVFCMTDDKVEKTLEGQEHFVEVARSRDVEVLEGHRQFVEVIGNMQPLTKSTEPLYVGFRPFRENRLPLVVRLRDLKAEPAGQVVFFPTPRTSDTPPTPICVLNIVLPGPVGQDAQTPDLEVSEIQLSEALKNAAPAGGVDQISRAELRLTDIADALQSDWVPLGRQLGLTQPEIIAIQRDYAYVSEQALVVLHKWIEKNKENATGNELERALQRINREDIVNQCMHNVEEVTSEEEKQQALAVLEGPTTTPTGYKFLETSFDDEVGTRQSKVPPRTTGDSPVLQVRKTIVPLNLPDWQLASAAEPAEDSPVEKAVPSEPLRLPVATEYADQQPIIESPVHVERKSDVSSQPVDWEKLDKPVPTGPLASFPSVTKQIIEGDVYESEEKSETTEQAEDGSDNYVRRLVTTRQQLQPITEVTLEDGVEVSQTTSNVVVAVYVDEFVDILPQGIVDPHADGLERQTSTEESQEPLEAGGTLTRRIITTTVRRLPAPEISRKPEEWHPDYPAGVEVMQDDAVPHVSLEKSEEKSEEPEELKPSISEPVSSSPPQATEPWHTTEQSSEPIQVGSTVSEVPPESVEHPAIGVDAPTEQTNEPVQLAVTLPQVPLESVEHPAFGGEAPTEQTNEPIHLAATLPQVPLESVEHEVIGDDTPLAAESSVTPVVELHEDAVESDEPDARGVRIYTDTTEGVPQVERDVQETEEVLPDGTVVRRQVVKTSQRQTISTRVVMEGPEDILPASKAEAEQLLGEMGVSEELGQQIAASDSAPQASTNVEEHEEVLPDGSIVKRRVVTTTKQHVTTERVSLEDDDIPAGDGHISDSSSSSSSSSGSSDSSKNKRDTVSQPVE